MPVFVVGDEDPELVVLRRFRARIEALLAVPGHITRAEVRAALNDTARSRGSSWPR